MSSATAAGETCRGEAATIVGTGPTVTGTEGRDVIVTGAATRHRRPRWRRPDLRPARRDDLQRAEGRRRRRRRLRRHDNRHREPYVTTTLGAGADTFTGGRPATPSSAAAQEPCTDTEADTIATGDGADSVVSGSIGAVNRDVVDTGAGDDSSTYGPRRSDRTPRHRKSRLRRAPADERLGRPCIDMASGTFTSPAGTATLTFFEHSTSPREPAAHLPRHTRRRPGLGPPDCRSSPSTSHRAPARTRSSSSLPASPPAAASTEGSEGMG